MANKTTTLGLTKPLRTEDYNVDDFNSNADKIDDYAKSTSKNITNLESSIDNHSHALNGTGIKGVLPISKGGTGATTASVAAKNLGITAILQQKADKEHKHTAKDIAETDEIKLMTATERNKLAQLAKYCYVVAARNSDNKHYADVVCSSTDADDTAKLQNLINAAPIGSIIHLIAGTYYVTAPLVLEKPVTIEGSGGATQLINTTGGYIFSIKHNYVRIKDMQLKRNSTALKVSSSYPLIEFYSIKSQIISDVEISSCLFDLNDMTACIGVDGKASGVITVDNPNSLTDMTQIRIKDNTFWGSTYTGRHIDFTRIKGNMSIVVGGNIGATKINITVQNKGLAVYNYGQDSNITYTTTNTASVVNSYDSASDDSNDEVKEVE